MPGTRVCTSATALSPPDPLPTYTPPSLLAKFVPLTYVVLLIAYIAGNGKAYYLASLYPAVLGLGALPAAPEEALLLADGRLWRWAPGGYADAGAAPPASQKTTVLTPRSTVRAIAAGYAAERHPSAR